MQKMGKIMRVELMSWNASGGLLPANFLYLQLNLTKMLAELLETQLSQRRSHQTCKLLTFPSQLRISLFPPIHFPFPIWSIPSHMPTLYILQAIIFKIIMQYLRSFYKFVCCISDPKFPFPYDFTFGHAQDLAKNKQTFQSNFVRTSKYHWYDFLPKSLLIQFKRLANIYFLIIGILQSIPEISPLGPLTAWAPLIVVLGISMIREGFQDYQRYKSDRQVNFESETQVFRNNEFIKVEWSDVHIGEIVKVEIQELFPTDLILLASSIQGGVAFIETASLDGEKNLKPRNAFPLTQRLNSVEALQTFAGSWHGIVPDKELHNFSSDLVLPTGETINYYKDKQLLYRGARLKNTKWIYGLTIYTGRNTKIMMNSDSSSEKMSQIQVKVNYILGLILALQIILCFILAVLDGVFINNNSSKNTYIIFTSYASSLDSFLIFCTYMVLLNTMIPISLIVSIEVVKMSQSYFINMDKLMFSQFRNKYSNVRSASLNEQLGQIEYVFTDKTGTLTLNLMQFKIAVIGSKMYGDLGLIINDPNRPPQKNKGFNDLQLKTLIDKGANNISVNDVFVKNKQGSQSISFKQMKELAEEFLTALSVAHEVVSETDKKGRKFYQGPSPDQITLVDAARDMGYEFVKSTQSTSQILIKQTEKRTFELLQVFPFNSDRKRMSVVVRSNGMIKMYIKGADSIIKSRLSKENRLNLDDELNRFSRIGLRTLLIGMRIISEAEYGQFRRNVEQLPPANKQQAYNILISELEQNIYLIGATAVLDRLQDDVPETIRDLIRANIKVWMLTGDKMQTAENIAKSCNLIQSNFQILRYECKDRGQAAKVLMELGRRAEELSNYKKPKAFLIEGDDLTPIIGNEENEIQLANLAKYCQAVVCCRLLPIQKAEVVRIVRQRLNKITLSIGDGANDVPMIKTAHIGVGLFGQQGMGAVQASDYALPQFRMLWRLLLVHGRWNYIRISQMILYFFYKNMLFTIPQFIYAFYCGYSGQTIFDDIYISLYNLVFTSIPLVVRAILEQDVYYVQPAKTNLSVTDDESSLNQIAAHKSHVLKSAQAKFVPHDYEMNKFLYRLFPKIYFIGQENCIFNYANFFMWTAEGMIEAVVITLFSIYILGTSSISSSGFSSDLWLVSLTIFTTVILVVTFKLSSHTKFWSVILFVSIIVLSLGLYVSYMWLTNFHFATYTWISFTSATFFTVGETYFIVLFGICFVLFLDGLVLSIDFQRGGYSSRMRRLIESQQEHAREMYKEFSIRSSEIITIQAKQAKQAIN